jgi:VanZ family protein
VIVYGSLYPFEFRIPVGGGSALSTLFGSWNAAPGRGDFVANVLLYMPLGSLGFLSLSPRMSVGFRLFVMIVGGTALSVSMELAQYYDVDRVTSATDVYANSTGALLGSFGAICLSGRRLPLVAEISARPVPVALIASWMGYRLYPYVPTIDLHKYWTALKPVILYPTLSFEDLCRHTTIWLTIFALISAVVGHRRSLLIIPLFSGALVVARVAVLGAVLSLAEIAGAIIALFLWPLLLALPPRRRSAGLFVLLGSVVTFERLQPFQFLPVGRPFEWLPFWSLMEGSIGVDVMSFFEKSFLYGSLLFLFREAGGRLGTAATLVCGMLFATSWAETYLPGRSAEITDATMALLLAAAIALTSPKAPTGQPGDGGTSAAPLRP